MFDYRKIIWYYFHILKTVMQAILLEEIKDPNNIIYLVVEKYRDKFPDEIFNTDEINELPKTDRKHYINDILLHHILKIFLNNESPEVFWELLRITIERKIRAELRGTDASEIEECINYVEDKITDQIFLRPFYEEEDFSKSIIAKMYYENTSYQKFFSYINKTIDSKKNDYFKLKYNQPVSIFEERGDDPPLIDRLQSPIEDPFTQVEREDEKQHILNLLNRFIDTFYTRQNSPVKKIKLIVKYLIENESSDINDPEVVGKIAEIISKKEKFDKSWIKKTIERLNIKLCRNIDFFRDDYSSFVEKLKHSCLLWKIGYKLQDIINTSHLLSKKISPTTAFYIMQLLFVMKINPEDFMQDESTQNDVQKFPLFSHVSKILNLRQRDFASFLKEIIKKICSEEFGEVVKTNYNDFLPKLRSRCKNES